MSLTMTGFRHKVTENAVYFHGDMNIMKSPCTASHCNQAYSERLSSHFKVCFSVTARCSVSVSFGACDWIDLRPSVWNATYYSMPWQKGLLGVNMPAVCPIKWYDCLGHFGVVYFDLYKTEE